MSKVFSESEFFLLTESVSCAILTLVELLLFALGVLSRASVFDDGVRPPLSSIIQALFNVRVPFFFALLSPFRIRTVEDARPYGVFSPSSRRGDLPISASGRPPLHLPTAIFIFFALR